MTRWHSRRAYILDIDPPQRAAWVMVSEYERKLLLWLTWVNFFFIPISLWYWYGQFTHLSSNTSNSIDARVPVPEQPEARFLMARHSLAS